MTSASRWVPAFSMCWMRSSCCSVGGRAASRRRSCENPRTALSGVRSSWLMRDRNSVLARLDASSASRACRSARAVFRSVTSRRTAVTSVPRSVWSADSEASSGNSSPPTRTPINSSTAAPGLPCGSPGRSSRSDRYGPVRGRRGMNRSTSLPIASSADAPNSRSAARLKSTMRSSASTVITASLTASTRPAIRTSPWRSAACMFSRSVMSKKVATAPSSRPSLSIGCDQYSIGNELPSARQNTSSTT